jgi:hypothetical protein
MPQTTTITSQSLIKPSAPPPGASGAQSLNFSKLLDDLSTIEQLIALVIAEENNGHFPMDELLAQMQSMIDAAQDMKGYDPSWGTLQNFVDNLISDLKNAYNLAKAGKQKETQAALAEILKNDIIAPLWLLINGG